MGYAIPAVALRIVGENSQAITSLKEVNAQLAISRKSMEKDFGEIRRVGAGAAIAIGAAFGVAAVTIGKSISEFADSDAVWGKLDDALGKVGSSYRALKPEIEAIASRTQKFTRYTDEDAGRALTNLVQQTRNVGVSMREVGLVFDLMIAKDLDLDAASKLVGRAILNQREGFSRLGVTLRDGIPVLDQLHLYFGGRAVADGQRVQAQMDRTRGAIGNVFEATGHLVVGDNAGKSIGRVADSIQGLADTIEGAHGTLNDFKEWIDHINSVTPTGIGKVFDWLKNQIPDRPSAAGYARAQASRDRSFTPMGTDPQAVFGGGRMFSTAPVLPLGAPGAGFDLQKNMFGATVGGLGDSGPVVDDAEALKQLKDRLELIGIEVDAHRKALSDKLAFIDTEMKATEQGSEQWKTLQRARIDVLKDVTAEENRKLEVTRQAYEFEKKFLSLASSGTVRKAALGGSSQALDQLRQGVADKGVVGSSISGGIKGSVIPIVRVPEEGAIHRFPAQASTFSNLNAAGGGQLADVKGQIGQVVAGFTPLGLAASALGSIFEGVRPVLDALKEPLRILGTIVGNALAPVLKSIFPIFKDVAIAATYVGQIFFKVAEGVAKGVGYVIYAIAKAIDKIIPFFDPLKGIEKLGQGIIDFGDGLGDAASAMADGRKELTGLTWDDAINNVKGLGDAAKEASQNIPTGFKVALAAYRATAGVAVPSGAILGGSSTASARSITVNAPITIVQRPGEDGPALAKRVGEELRRLKARGGVTDFDLAG